MTELATLAPEVEASLGADADPASVPTQTMRDALAAVAATLRSEADRPAEGGETGTAFLRDLADRLEAPHAWSGVDRLVHELVSGLVADALAAPEGERLSTLVARAFALRALARQETLWPGASDRMGCPYDYDGLLATVRLTAIAA